MQDDGQIRAAALAQGRRLKRTNALTALLCGALPGLFLGLATHPSLRPTFAGLAIGLLWANAFEYVYHRFLLHWPKSSFGKGHLLHHRTLGKPEEAEHVTFGSSPLYVAALFAVNGIPVVLAHFALGWRIAPGILAGFSLYMIAVEEIHWRIHLGGRLPPGLGWARIYHMAHHDIADGRYNVFLPIFDLIFGNMRPPLEQTQADALARVVAGADRPYAGMDLFNTAFSRLWFLVVAVGIRYLWNSRPALGS